MKHTPKNIVIGIGNNCPKCSKPMERRRHAGKIRNPHCYYSKWDYCNNCKHVQHYEEYKCQVWKEIEQTKNLFNNL